MIDIVDKKIIVAPVMLAPNVDDRDCRGGREVGSAVADLADAAGLLNAFTKEQIVELMAFLDSGGDRNAAVYRKKMHSGRRK